MRVTTSGIRFGFDFLGRHFEIAVKANSSGAEMELSARLAALPYSAENATVRNAAMAIIGATRSARGFRFAVSRQQQIYCLASARLGEPLQPASLIATVVGLLLDAKPYIETLRDVVPSWVEATA